MCVITHKKDVPFFGHPALWLFAVINLIGMFVVAILVEPLARPGVIEFLIGAVLAWPFSRSLSAAWIDYIKSKAKQSAESMTSDTNTAGRGSEWSNLRVAGIGPYAGMFATALVAYLIWVILRNLGAPWARYSNIPADFPVPIQSISISLFVYLISYPTYLCMSIIRWYRSLPG